MLISIACCWRFSQWTAPYEPLCCISKPYCFSAFSVVEIALIAIVVPPTAVPIGHPTIEASTAPTENFYYSSNVNDDYFITSPPFASPSADPSVGPTEDLTADPTANPDADPTEPSGAPSGDPSVDPSADRFQIEGGG